ncbi:glycosyltransferase [Aeromicrobium flavum]|uniref:glycosyltransferase n=1 Tax=Aeromicrobium flavum TaxID=416568 RepID=UPI001C999879|nr:glycosyltransferase family 2 protein [Aeromicrobium flavum]
MTGVSVIVPVFNEAPNVAELVRRVSASLGSLEAEIVFVDDSTDETPDVIRAVAATSELPVRLIHRDPDEARGGLGGAVVEGIRAAAHDRCVVMDGDLQHPPEKIPELLAKADRTDGAVVVASRYVGDGTNDGLSGFVRVLVSRASTLVTKAMFPVRLRAVTDPMTGFFLVSRDRVDFAGLQPRGFKILLEILARQSLSVSEIPFHFAERFAGESKASLTQGIRFLLQLASLRFGRMSGFAMIGALGAVANIAIVWLLTMLGLGYVAAAVVAAEVTIVGNFLLIEHFVFADLRRNAGSGWARFAKSFGFNNVEAAIRIPVLAFMVETWHVSAVVATAMTLLVAFVVRFVFHSLVVYAPTTESDGALPHVLDELDQQLRQPGEL